MGSASINPTLSVWSQCWRSAGMLSSLALCTPQRSLRRGMATRGLAEGAGCVRADFAEVLDRGGGRPQAGCRAVPCEAGGVEDPEGWLPRCVRASPQGGWLASDDLGTVD
jgi:hypothetical protein